MNLHQIVITKNVLGQYKLSIMSTDRTEEVYRGEFWEIAWRAMRQMCKLKAVKGALPHLCLVLFVTAALAQDHKHPVTESELHDRFYAGWNMPSDRTKSCCNKMDCFPTEARHDGRRWSAWSRVKQDWIVIPERHIEREYDVPMGAHLCENHAGVLCFGVGNGS